MNEYKINGSLRYNIAERLDQAGRKKALAIRKYIIDQHQIGTTTWHIGLKSVNPKRGIFLRA